MKKLLLSILALATAILVGCQRDYNTVVGDRVAVLTVSISDTRTYLGEKVDGLYPVYWSEGDKIVVNGVVSNEVVIDTKNPALATFTFNSDISKPYYVISPYSEAIVAKQSVVVFPAEQNYTKGSYDKDSAIMCGYSENEDVLTLKHLNGIVRFSVIAANDGVVLDKIVVNSTNKIAGEFTIDCREAKITAKESATSTITYTVNEPLSTVETKDFYITIPAVDAGECTVEFFDTNGDKMIGYWSANNIKAGIVREFADITYKANADAVGLVALGIVDDELLYNNFVNGYVKDNAGKPIANVAVSDGFNVVTTDANGYYSMEVSSSCWYVYISLPAEYEVPINEYGQPCFYQKYDENNERYDFTLTPLAGGKENEFALLAIGDPQVSNTTALSRFNTEAVPALNTYCTSLNSKIPSYAITLGDLISNGVNNNDEGYRDNMRDGFSIHKIGIPVFHTMGNHDHTRYTAESSLVLDRRSPTVNLKIRRNHEDMFGPVNYSFNRGDFHIVAMKNILYKSLTNGGDFSCGFTQDDYEWLRRDLSLVPKTKAVVLCVHIQIFAQEQNFLKEVKELLNTYNDAHIMSGHSHVNCNYEHEIEGLSTTKVYEHNAGALCGAWWCSNMCGDGTPNGFQVFVCGNDGAGNGKVKDWYFMGYHEGMNTREKQMRLYRGDAITGGAIAGDNPNGVKGYYAFNYGKDVLLANVYNADSKWVVRVYEDDAYTGDMERLAVNNPTLSACIGDYTWESPRRPADGSLSSHDMYVAGLFLGVLDRYGASGSWAKCSHMYRYTLTNPKSKSNIEDIKIRVEATDRFGNVYTETKITEGTDYSLTARK